MTSPGILAFLVLAGVASLCYAQSPIVFSPIITLPQGQIKGFEEYSTDGKPIYSFKGIPYANSPNGSLRFEAPVEHEQWSGVLEAIQDPEPCVQHNVYHTSFNTTPYGDEDCLYLNVFTPKPIGQNLPVMVFIHGFAWVGGSAADYTPFVLLNEDIILVVIQYRLGVFGFLSTEDLSMPGNLGLKDQRLALQWVQNNIAQFGGSPSNVTVFGDSAGAASVHLHMLSPDSAGLFNGAIAQSGTALCPWAVGKMHRIHAERLGESVNCTLEENSDDFKSCLKDLDPYELHLASLVNYQWGITPFAYSPRVDGDFIPDEPSILIKNGTYNKVNLINGINRDEGALFVALLFLYPMWKQSLVDNFTDNAPFSLFMENENNSENLTTTIYEYYLQGKSLADNPVNEEVKMFSDTYFNIGTDYANLLHAQDSEMELYLYEMEYKGQNSITNFIPLPEEFQYISHEDMLFYLFSGGPYYGHFPALSQEDVEVSKNIIKMWTNFAKFGNPTPDLSLNFEWSPATSTSFEHLNITQTPSMIGYSRNETLQFWMSLNTDLKQQIASFLLPRTDSEEGVTNSPMETI